MWNRDYDQNREDMVLDEIDSDLGPEDPEMNPSSGAEQNPLPKDAGSPAVRSGQNNTGYPARGREQSSDKQRTEGKTDAEKQDSAERQNSAGGRRHTGKQSRNLEGRRLSAGDRVSDFFFYSKDWLTDRKQMLIPLALVLLSLLAGGIALIGYGKRQEKLAQDSAAAEETAGEEQIPALEENAHEDINNLMRTYFDALADGDINTVAQVTSGLDANEQVQITELANYIDSYPSIDVYSKPGKADGTYICFVVTKVKFKDRDELIPGMQTIYVCTNDQGSLYINEDESDQDTISYIREVSQQSDVVDLSNRVQEDYNSLLASDPDLKQYITDTYNSIQVAVAEALGDAQDSSDAVSGSTAESSESSTENSTAAAAEGQTADDAQASSSSTGDTVTALRATDAVNVRRSASETADVIGQTEPGKDYALISKGDDGWSKITFEGMTGYVRTEYFTDVTGEDAGSASSEDSGENSSTGSSGTESSGNSSSGSSTGSSDTSHVGTAKTSETVTIRSEASADSDRAGTVWGGFSVTVLEKGDTWSKIEYNGTTGYIKNEFLNFD